jgi:hypothetical protein
MLIEENSVVFYDIDIYLSIYLYLCMFFVQQIRMNKVLESDYQRFIPSISFLLLLFGYYFAFGHVNLLCKSF